MKKEFKIEDYTWIAFYYKDPNKTFNKYPHHHVVKYTLRSNDAALAQFKADLLNKKVACYHLTKHKSYILKYPEYIDLKSVEVVSNDFIKNKMKYHLNND